MQTTHRPLLLLLAFSFSVTSLFAGAQVVIATLPVGSAPSDVAVDSVNNRIYVANWMSDTVTVIDGATNNTATVRAHVAAYHATVNSVTNKIYVTGRYDYNLAVIDGVTLATQTVYVGSYPVGVAVNSVTNKIYVPLSSGTVTVIDGGTLSTQSVTVGADPGGVAVNSVTNTIYVTNQCGNDPACGSSSSGTVTVIDGVTLSAQTVTVGVRPLLLAVNPVTNKLYVVNRCGNDCGATNSGTVTVIDGTTLVTQTVSVGSFPYGVAVNSATNKTYVTNQCGNDPSCSGSGTVTAIDGTTLSTQTVTVGINPLGVAVNSVTNEVFVTDVCGNDPMCSSSGTVTIINGATNSTAPVAVGDYPQSLGVNPGTNRIYVANVGDNSVSVIARDTTLQFVPATPCRVVDTRNPNGPFGGPPIPGGTYRSFQIPQGACDIPATAAAYSLNVTLVPDQGTPVGYLTLWPAGEIRPFVSTLNSLDGRVKANAAIVQAGVSGAVSVYVTDASDVLLDIDGYFVPAGPSTLNFYPLPPCRVVDTRNGQGGPTLQGQTEYDYAVQGNCGIPSGAQAYSFNFTVIPVNNVPVGYLTVWPQGQPQPTVSTLNDYTATVVANAGIVQAGGNGGEIAAYVYTTGQANLLVDVNGYFAPPVQGGLSLYPTASCRVLDTRNGNGAFTGTLNPPVDVLGSPCGVPSQSQAYVLNATVVPLGSLGYLTLWPDGQQQPGVSTLNAYDGAITSNMAIVPAGNNGKIDAFAYGTTNLILDISSYFAP
jgi:YVTN family beta-propeller protein